MKKHILSKKCWCKPEVISFKEPKEDKILQIAALFNDSMDNVKYNKIRKILKSLQMEIEVETGLKNFQVTMKELANARREVIEKVEKELKEVQFIYEHQWTGSDEERLCETCREVVKKRSPCRASSHYSCWRVIEDVLATLKEEEKI